MQSFLNYLLIEGLKKKGAISIWEPALVSNNEGDKYSRGRKLHSNIPNALAHNRKNMFYSFDLTNRCNRGCPGCYVDRAKEISCNAVKDLPIKEYKGDIQKWEEWASKSPENKEKLDDSKQQINANGGIRMFSVADYPDSSDPFYVELMREYGINDKDYFRHNVTAFLDDAKQHGWHVKAITKEISFLKDHIHHDALKGVDVSMNSQGFGLSHEAVKALKHGNHNHKNLSDDDKEHLGSKLSKADAKNIKNHSSKIIGRTVTHTPFDLTKILEYKGDDSHIGVITSAHNIPTTGVRFTPSKPKNPMSPKTIIMQVNFPTKFMHWLDGDSKYPSIRAVTAELNKYADKYNKLRDKASSALKKGTINVLEINVQKSKEDSEYDKELEEAFNPETHYKVVTTLVREGDKWKQIVTSTSGKRTETDAHIIDNIEEEFDHINPPFTHVFSDEDTKHLLSKMQGKMCCAGEEDNKAAGGKCHRCKAKCGVKGCGSNVENSATDKLGDDIKPIKKGKEEVKESSYAKFTELLEDKYNPPEWNKFPVVRPTIGKEVEVVIDKNDGKFSKGSGINTKNSGIGILVDGKLIDSNSIVYWRYVKEVKESINKLVDLI